MAPRPKRQRLSADGDGPIAEPPLEKEGAPAKKNQQNPASGNTNTQQRRTLFVRSLPFTATTEQLTDYFSQSYPLKHATVVLDPVTKKSKGYGFVTFADAEDAERAVEELNGAVFDGRKIKVEVAEPRHREIAAGDDVDGHRKSTLSTAAVQAKAEREKKPAEARLPPKLIVRNLPWSIKKPDQLAALFRSYGKVKHAVIPAKKPGLLAGFGFVVMRGRKNAEKAIGKVNGKEVDGRMIAVDWAVEKEVWEGLQKAEEAAEEADTPMDDAESEGAEAASEGEEDGEDGGVELESDGENSSADVSDDGFEDDFDEDRSLEGSEDNGDDHQHKVQDNSSTIFIRNLPFSSTDDSLREHFIRFGAVRYARVVMDHVTERPRGTGFVCFYNTDDADSCIREAPRSQPTQLSGSKKGDAVAGHPKHSVLQDDGNDPTGRYTMDGRFLQVTRAVDRHEAAKLNEMGSELRNRRDMDKRRLYLLSEGTIPSNSALYNTLAPSEIAMREASLKQRKALLQGNPSLHLSLTRLSVRNVPRSITSKDLKALAREAVVGFAKDVKSGLRKQLSKEEEARGGDEMRDAEKLRKAKGKGIVRQAKVVFEGREGSKVPESSGAGRSRGYGFIEYSSHRWALMGLRWMNGHAVGQMATEGDKSKGKQDKADKKKRLIVEFAIENAQVVARRKENEAKARERSKLVSEKRTKGELPSAGKKPLSKDTLMAKTRKGSKRKRNCGDDESDARKRSSRVPPGNDTAASADQEKLAKRQKIIARKRMMRRSRAKGARG